MKFSFISFFSSICMHLEYSCRSSVTIVLLFHETYRLIPCTIFKKVCKFPQSFGEPGYKGKPWKTVFLGKADSSELKAFQVGN